MEPAAIDYARMVGLERENQALRDQIQDFQRLLQNKDAEITLKYHLLQARERENAQARLRLAGLEAHLAQAAGAAAAAASSAPAPSAPDEAADDQEKPEGDQRTLERSLLLRFNSVPGASERPSELRHLGCVGVGETRLTEAKADSSAAAEPEASVASAHSEVPEARGEAEKPAQAPPTPNKRLAIVDPSSGKQIEVSPTSSATKMKPTLSSLEAISATSDSSRHRSAEGSQAPSGVAAPPLTLPPVVAGAPPGSQASRLLSSSPPALHAGALSSPSMASLGVPGLPPPGLVQGMPGLPGYPPFAPPLPGLGLPPPPVPLTLPGGPCPFPPPPLHAAVDVAASQVADDAGGPVQLARGPLTGGDAAASAAHAASQAAASAAVPNPPPGPPLGLPPQGAQPHPPGASGLLGFAGYGAPPTGLPPTSAPL